MPSNYCLLCDHISPSKIYDAMAHEKAIEQEQPFYSRPSASPHF